MEKLVIKIPRKYIFGLVLLAVLAFSYLPNNASAAVCLTGYEPSENNRCTKVDPSVAGAEILCQEGYRFKESVCTEDEQALNANINAGIQQQKDLAATGQVPVATGGGNITCGSWIDLGNHLWECGIYSIGSGILWLFAKLVYLAGILFDTALRISVLQIKTYMDSPSVSLVWGTVRDLANIIFIFFLLWISIQTILGLGDGKKALPGIIITALLINFSLFFTRVIIDTSNIVALQFYNGIVDPKCNNDLDGCVSDNLMKATQLSTVYGAGKSGAKIPITTTNTIIITIFGSIFFLITAFVLLQAAFLFIARTVVLVLLAAISPLAFVSNIVPKMKSYHDDWWKNVINQALVAPIFLLFIWIVIKISSTVEGGSLFAAGAGGAVDTGSFADAFINGGSSMNIVFGFFFLIGLMYFALKITKEYSGTFGTTAVDFGGKALGMIGGGAGGALLRNTLGLGASRLARSEGFQRFAGKSLAGEYLMKGTRGLAGGSYDLRAGVPLVGGIAGKALKQAGADVDFGKAGGEGGFNESLKKRTEEKVAFGKSLDRSTAGRTAFAKRTATSTLGLAHPASITVAGALGRDNRVAAAQIFKDRIKELNTDLKELRTEENGLKAIQKAHIDDPAINRPLTADENIRLNGAGPGSISSDRGGKELEKAGLDAEVAALGLQDTLKKQY